MSISNKSDDESLSDRTNRAKARWLKRVMYESAATSTQKVFAYAIADHLNCVTLDCWPGQPRCARLLGRRSIKTALRAARGLAALGLITVKRSPRGKQGYRYAPVFLPGDEDKSVLRRGQECASSEDADVGESSLETSLESSSNTAAFKGRIGKGRNTSPFNRAERGAYEIRLAQMLGANGLDVLARLGAIDDASVDRLCVALAEGRLGERDLAAAVLAAEQA